MAAKAYCDELTPILGMKRWFPTTASGEFNYGPDGTIGSQIFFYQALEPAGYSRGTGQGCSIWSSWCRAARSCARPTSGAVSKGAEMVREPRDFPEYGVHYATFFLDPNGIMIEAVCHEAE